MIIHDRWKQIKEIFYSAQELTPAERSAFLSEVCGNDAAMREEVEALLTADAGNDDFLSAPAYEFAAGMLADEKSAEESEFSSGQNLGRYEILCPLGSGGMGQIYLAYDAQLHRKIALKLISREFATDPRRVQRFEQEARAASALNHPNVCVIYETGITENGRHFIAMEHIQGETLRDKLWRGPLQPVEALRIAIQVGAALASAHAVGIIHRDIKPENIMLRSDGLVKVVDFGLAKLTELLPEQRHDDGAETKLLTEPHTIMGTVKYMSPEQLRETPVDERTDIWSLGVVLYEMLTTTTPFEARSRNDSIARILGPQPAELRFPDEVPVEFREIVKKALEKDGDQRYQTVTKLRADLSKLKWKFEHNEESYITSVPELEPISIPQGSAIFTRLKSQATLTADFLLSEIRTHQTAAIFIGATGVLALLFFLPAVARWINGTLKPEAAKPGATKVFQLPLLPMKRLTDAGKSVCATVSSDGRWVAHAERQNEKQQLVVTSATTPDSRIAVPADNVTYLGISFSLDNQYLYFTRTEKSRDGILYRLAWPAGTDLVKVKEGVDSPISFSPNGDRFAFVRYDEPTTEYSLIVSDIDGGNEQVIASRKDGDTLSVYGLAWSPDGNMILCPTAGWENGWHMNLVGFDLKNGREQPIGNQSWFSIQQVAWQQDMESLIVSATARQTAPHQLWRISFPEGVAQTVTNDLSQYSSVSLAGERIVTVQSDRSLRIWIVSPADSSKATPITSGVGLNYGINWTSKGKILFSSMAQDRLNIFRIDADGSNQIQLTVNAGDNFMPVSSPDGQYIVFSSNRNGFFNIWRMNADGSDPIQLTNGKGDFYPSVSPDNQWIAYDNIVKSRASVWKVPLTGGEPVKVGEKYRMPVFSPNNQSIACRFDGISGSNDVAIFPAQGGQPLRYFKVPNQEWQSVQWLNDREVSYVKNAGGYSNIWTYNLETGASKQITHFNDHLIYAYAWSPDYKQIACLRGTPISNVAIIGNSEQ
jgi:eukaryotic-like serine/threonine-protein kinase